MAFDAALADRIRPLLKGWAGLAEKKMFGGVGFLLYGNMCCGVWKEFLLLRLGPEAGAKALEEPHVREFDITGRPMAGWVMVDPDGLAGDALAEWIDKAREFVLTLPAKTESAKSSPQPRRKKSARRNQVP